MAVFPGTAWRAKDTELTAGQPAAEGVGKLGPGAGGIGSPPTFPER